MYNGAQQVIFAEWQ